MKNFFEQAFKGIVVILFTGFFLLLAQELRVTTTEATFVQQVLVSGQAKIKRALFSPDDEVKRVLIGLINGERSRMRIAIYTLTDSEVSRAIIDAVRRGVIVELIVDRGSLDSEWSKVPSLIKEGVCIFVYPRQHMGGRDPLMHNKFVIFSHTLGGRQIVWTGSFNFTRSAAHINQENVLVLEDRDIAYAYVEQFKRIKKRSVLVSGNEPLVETRAYGEEYSWFEKLCSLLGMHVTAGVS